jgi:hypothetical protein
MKSVLFTLVIFLTIAAQKCKKERGDNIPSCIQQKIEEIKKQPKWNPPAEVYEYRYNGMRVFYFTSNCCDQYNAVYDENCNYLCAPSGGITGKGDGKCNDFIEKAEKLRLVWKDNR